ncbi:MAG: hypothetical protein Kilf2KO_39000 [Rhodospirillales bacterium]
MPRPSLREARRAQILDAYERCIVRYGVEGSSLEAVAKEAGLARALIRHNVGNRDALLQAAVERFLERSRVALGQLLEALPAERPLECMIEWLFDTHASDPHLALVSNALVAAGASDPALAAAMRDWTDGFFEMVAEAAARGSPNAGAEELDTVAAGIASAYFVAESVTPIGPMPALRANCKAAALRLAGSLAT